MTAAQRTLAAKAYYCVMCSHYQALRERSRFERFFGVSDIPEGAKHDLWPGYMGLFIRPHPHAGIGDDAVPEKEVLLGSFGMVPAWAKDLKIARHTYNARSETVATKPSFRDAWEKAQHCIIPAEFIVEPDWRSGKAVKTRIRRADGQPMGIAGLWAWWKLDQGDSTFSYTMLTINADTHPLMRNFHKPEDEKRMVVVLPEEHYACWLNGKASESRGLLEQYPADGLIAETLR